MLNLLDRQTIEDLTLYRDDQDVRKFYVLPDTPTIAQDAQGRPRFMFVKYVDDREGVEEADERNGAYTQFHATLAIDEERRSRVLAALQAQLEEEKRKGIKPFGKPIQSTEPLLARPDWVDGSVTLATFEPREDGMVRSVAGSKKPDLAGDLGAAFALELDAAAAAIFWDAFESGNVPIVLAYELTYKARVPAASMVIHAEREKVQTAVWELALPMVFRPALRKYVSLGVSVGNRAALIGLRATHGPSVKALVPRRKLQTAVKNVIDVKISFGEGGGSDEVRTQLMSIANDILANNIVPAFFAGNAILSELTDIEDGDELLELKDSIEESLEPFHIELSEEVAVDRTANPSGIIQMLLTPEQRALAFREVPLSDPFFQQLDVKVRSAGVQFERDGIDSIHVFLEYDHVDAPTGDRVYKALDQVLKSETGELTFQVERLARTHDKMAITRYRIRTEIYYRVDLPKSVGSWIEQEHRQVLVAPDALGAIRVELVLTARPETIEAAEVELSYRAASGSTLARTITLSAASPRASWFQFTGEFGPRGQRPRYQYRTKWKLPGGAVLVDEPRSSDGDVLEIGSPFTTPLQFTIRPEGTFEGIEEIVGELRYDDAARDYHVVRGFSLKGASASETITVPTLEGGPRSATIEGRIRYQDATRKELPKRTIEPGTLYLGATVSDWLEVYIQPFEVDWKNDVRVATVLLTYEHADGRIERSAPLNFLEGGPNKIDDTTIWKVALSEGDARSFSYDVRYVGRDGRSDSVSFSDVTDTMVWLRRPAAEG